MLEPWQVYYQYRCDCGQHFIWRGGDPTDCTAYVGDAVTCPKCLKHHWLIDETEIDVKYGEDANPGDCADMGQLVIDMRPPT